MPPRFLAFFCPKTFSNIFRKGCTLLIWINDLLGFCPAFHEIALWTRYQSCPATLSFDIRPGVLGKRIAMADSACFIRTSCNMSSLDGQVAFVETFSSRTGSSSPKFRCYHLHLNFNLRIRTAAEDWDYSRDRRLPCCPLSRSPLIVKSLN